MADVLAEDAAGGNFIAEERVSKKSNAPKLVPFPSSIPLVLVILSVVLAFVLYVIIAELAPTVEDDDEPCVLSTGLSSPTMAKIKFSWFGTSMPGPGQDSPSCQTDLMERMFDTTWPPALKIVLSNDTHSGTYLFQSFEDGALVLDRGDHMGNLTYSDLADNGRINYGDVLRLEGLGPGSHYTFEIVWNSTDEIIAVADFSTPNQ